MGIVGLLIRFVSRFPLGLVAMSLLLIYMLSSIATHQFEESALLTARGCVLVEEGEMLLIELREEFIPGNIFKGPLTTVARKVDTQ